MDCIYLIKKIAGLLETSGLQNAHSVITHLQEDFLKSEEEKEPQPNNKQYRTGGGKHL